MPSNNFFNRNKNINEFPAQINTIYYISLTKSLEIQHGQPIVFLFTGLTKKQYQNLGASIRKRVIPIHSKIIEVPIDQMPKFAIHIPEGTFTEKISKEEFEELYHHSQEDDTALFHYPFKYS